MSGIENRPFSRGSRIERRGREFLMFHDAPQWNSSGACRGNREIVHSLWQYLISSLDRLKLYQIWLIINRIHSGINSHGFIFTFVSTRRYSLDGLRCDYVYSLLVQRGNRDRKLLPGVLFGRRRWDTGSCRWLYLLVKDGRHFVCMGGSLEMKIKSINKVTTQYRCNR